MTSEQILNLIRVFFEITGALATLLILVAGLSAFAGWLFGAAPLIRRLGLGRWYRRVQIVAKSGNYEDLRDDLLDSGIFRKKNISQISATSLSAVKDADLLLLDYQSFTADEVKQVIIDKPHKAGMLVYFPAGLARIPDDVMDLINHKRRTVVVNFRGRLVNDLVVTLLSTSYDKK